MSSILNNASVSLGLKALQSCRRQTPYQKKLGILHLPYASYTPDDFRHFTKSSLNPFTAVEEASSEQVLPSGRSDRLIYWKELRLKALNSLISQSSPKVSCTFIAKSISATGSWKSRTDHSKHTKNEPSSIKANSKAKADQAAVDNVKTTPNAGLEKASPWEISSYREEPIYEKDDLIQGRKESEEKKIVHEKEFSQALRTSLPDIAHGDYVNTNALSHILKIFLSESLATPPRSKISDEQDLAVLSRVFRKNALRELSKRGYLPEDVAVWAWILSAQGSIRAALRLFLWNRQSSPPRRAPLFVLKLLLHRPHLDVRAYRILLSCALSYLLCQPLRSTTADSRFIFANAPPEPESVILKANEASPLITILLRRSREMLPTAQINIAEAYAHFLLNLLPLSEYGAAQWEVNRLQAEGFNSCLRLLGIPSEIQPLTSTFHQQQAQFELLKSMAAHKPVIPVSRQGYQAIVAVQMAHVKTPAEKIFAKQKALSWPPWKEARMGIDAERGNEGMQSRAMQVLSQMTEAGYCHTTWDDVAGILAGWDTDGTPTIQTRSLARPQKALAAGIKQPKINSIVWASRIRATRTLREAWACFLSYEARYAVASEPVYHAMARKLIYQQQESDHIFTTDEILPGDGYEVFPEPSSARDVTYVPTEPPTLEELLERMLLQGILPGPDFVAVLIRYAPDIPTGLRYIAAFLSPKQTKAIITLSSGDFTANSANLLQLMKPSLFNSIIAFFCAQSHFSGRLKHLRKADHFPILMPRPTRVEHYTITLLNEDNLQGEDGTGNLHTLSHAVKLLLAARPQRVAAWLPLLKALGSPLRWIEDRSTKPHVHWFSAWYEASIVIRWMQELELEPGMEGFITVCQIYARAVRVGTHDVTAADASLASVQEMSRLNNNLHLQFDTEFESFVNRGLRMLKSYFDRLVLPMPPTLSNQNAPGLESARLNTSELIGQAGLGVPDMIQVPTPSALHEFVRALGTAEDHNGILELLEWMSRHAIEIAERADQRPGGRRMLRRTLTAIRVFLEDLNAFKMSRRRLETLVNKEATFDFYHRMEGTDESISQNRPVFTDPRVEEAYMLIEKAGVWGSWPSNDEVRVYLERNVHSRE